MKVDEIIKWVKSNYSDWNYYNSKELSEVDLSKLSDDNCRKFINCFWRCSEKDLSGWSELLSEHRIRHITFLYFLGLFIYKNNNTIQKSIDSQMNSLKIKYKLNDGVTFPYVWFLIILSHDLFYTSVDADCEIKDGEIDKFDNLIKLSLCVPEFFQDKALIKKYLTYRRERDHGICAGLKLFDKLCEIRMNSIQIESSKNRWDKELESIYSEVSWIILVHNIWFSKRDGSNLKEYQLFKLDTLIQDKGSEYKVGIDRYPLLCLLYIADTIEPTKVFQCYDSLAKVNIVVNNTNISVSTSLKCACAQEFLDNAYNLGDWLTKTTKSEGKKRVILSIPNVDKPL